MHIGVAGPIRIQDLKAIIKSDTDCFPNGLGGVPVNHLIISLINRGFKVSVFSLSPDVEYNMPFEYHQDSFSIYIGNYRRSAKSRALDFFAKERQQLIRMIKSASPDLVHAHWQYEFAWASLSSGYRTLVTCHDAPLRILYTTKSIYRLIRLMMACHVLWRAKYLTAVSAYTARQNMLLGASSVAVIPNFEPEFVFRYQDTRTFQPKKQLSICMVNAGFDGLKNVAKGVEAFVALRHFHPQVSLYLYGDGHGPGEEAEIWCEQRGYRDGIHYCGKKSFDKLMQCMSKHDILLHTSLEESCPMVIVEAMAIGLVCVAGKYSGGVPEVISDAGVLVDVTSCAEVLNGLLQACDHEKQMVLARRAKRRALSTYSESVVVEMYLNAYKTIIYESNNK